MWVDLQRGGQLLRAEHLYICCKSINNPLCHRNNDRIQESFKTMLLGVGDIALEYLTLSVGSDTFSSNFQRRNEPAMKIREVQSEWLRETDAEVKQNS